MSLNINTVRQSGFTIVELLIVVVVIAILAAITIVSYNGITQQANASAAKSTAATFQKKAELYYSDKGHYPYSGTVLNDSDEPFHITTGFTYTAADTDSTSTLTSETGKNTVLVIPCGGVTDTTITGLEIRYYNYEGSQPSDPQITLGTC
jgi:prepilin-type N-terminal cleavage/methylation domain-containing protein